MLEEAKTKAAERKKRTRGTRRARNEHLKAERSPLEIKIRALNLSCSLKLKVITRQQATNEL